MPVTKNPTIEIAILKELLTNLIEISLSRPQLKDKAKTWKEMLAKLPEYRINFNDKSPCEKSQGL